MRKEQLVAIILGSAIGIAVAFSLWKFSRPTDNSSQQLNTQNQTTNSSQTGTTNSTNEFSIVSPQDLSVVRDQDTTITGLANANAVIVGYSEEISFTKANSAGEFSLELQLSSGLNKITILSFDPGQKAKKAELTLIYSSALPAEGTAFTSQLGTITDVTEDTLQIRGVNGEINQLAINEQTTFAKIIDDTEDIEFSDVAIGDYIAALGQINSNVMNVSRILVTTEPEASSITSVSGTIDTLSASEFFVKSHETQDLVSIDATSGATTYTAKEEEIASTRLSTAEEGDEIIVVGEMEDDELVADTLILL